MKIKYLKIRNIASIEKADIDFENDLRAENEKQPASLFLITGDTGAGKSVILDCISMSLYGTTPRIKGVANRANNSFRSDDGNEIKIHDISQYTRLGISSKDECFSELTFEGNDGIEYVSRFSLGIVRTGKLRPASWQLRIGDKEIIEGNKKEEIKSRIVKAVGLSYDQFCRMAMLAQGQFASFLTGGKEERERILEQLTSTQHFSRYGEAIERIYKRAKQNKEEKERALTSESSRLLTEDELEDIRKNMLEMSVKSESLKKDIKRLDDIIYLNSYLRSRIKEKEETEIRLADNQRQYESEEFQALLKAIADWDNTTSERAILIKKKEAEKSRSNALNEMVELSAELSYSNSYISVIERESEQKKEELNKKEREAAELERFRNIFE
ncbi:MAG: AAA family ATPase, partial [Muribaculaceae bacterium]|nr:AAA family ATPase [Muribaculaceae bacterium]